MEPVRLWAAVEFTAQSGSTDALLGHAAQAGLHLTRIVPLPADSGRAVPPGITARWPLWPAGACASAGRKASGAVFSAASTAAPHRAVGRAGAVYSAAAVEASNSSGPWTPAPSPADRPPGPLPYCGRQTSPQGLPPPKPSAPPGSMPCWKAASFPGPVSILPKGDWKSAPAAAVPKPAIAAGTLHGPARPVRRCGHQDQPDQRHDAGGARAGRGGWTGADRHGAAGAGRCTDLCPGAAPCGHNWSGVMLSPFLLEETVLQPTGRYTVRYRLSAAGRTGPCPVFSRRNRHWSAPGTSNRSCWGCRFPAPWRKPPSTSSSRSFCAAPKPRRWHWRGCTACRRCTQHSRMPC